MNPRNYQKELDRILKDLKRTDRVPHLLLHSCCGPCSSYVLEYLAPFFKITVFYDNPNIQPRAEYEHRFAEQRHVIAHIQAPHGIALWRATTILRATPTPCVGLTHLARAASAALPAIASACRPRRNWRGIWDVIILRRHSRSAL